MINIKIITMQNIILNNNLDKPILETIKLEQKNKNKKKFGLRI